MVNLDSTKRTEWFQDVLRKQKRYQSLMDGMLGVREREKMTFRSICFLRNWVDWSREDWKRKNSGVPNGTGDLRCLWDSQGKVPSIGIYLSGSFPNCLSLGKLLNLSVSSFPHLQSEDHNPFSVGLLWRINELRIGPGTCSTYESVSCCYPLIFIFFLIVIITSIIITWI